MIISCTKCHTRYVVAPQAIGKNGRMVKCSKCAHKWFEEPPEEDLEIVPEHVIDEGQSPETTAEDDMKPKQERKEPVLGDKETEKNEIRRNVPAVIKESSHGILAGWFVLGILLIGLVFSLFYFRGTLEDRYDVAENLYLKWDVLVMGKELPVQPTPPPMVETRAHPAASLSLRQSAEVRFIEGAPSLALALEITNSGATDVELPILNGVIKNTEGLEVFTWVMKLDPSNVPAGGMQQYNINVDNIPLESATAEVSFDWN